MKLTTDFIDELFECLSKMGDGVILTDFSLTTPEGIKVNLSDVKEMAGLLHYQGQQVVVFIPDHSFKTIPIVLQNPFSQGNKFHFAECVTLAEMRASGRFEHRYHAHQNMDGEFKIFDAQHQAIVQLAPCQNCLKHVNYQGFNHANSQKRKTIIERLTLKVLFSTYSTLFKELPRKSVAQAGYTADWKEISLSYRANKNHTCEICGVNLSDHKSCLHTHHKDGNKQNNAFSNLQALCIDCHRKQHFHDHLLITLDEMNIIQQQRKKQGQLTQADWRKVFAMLDEAWYGILHHYLSLPDGNAIPLPELTFELADVARLDMAWNEVKIGFKLTVSVDEKNLAKIKGWRLMDLTEATYRMNALRSDAMRTLPKLTAHH